MGIGFGDSRGTTPVEPRVRLLVEEARDKENQATGLAWFRFGCVAEHIDRDVLGGLAVL